MAPSESGRDAESAAEKAQREIDAAKREELAGEIRDLLDEGR